MSKTQAWGDESIRTARVPEPMYLMGACVGDFDELTVRTAFNELKPSNAKKLHWKDMRPITRRKAIRTMRTMAMTGIITLAAPISRWNTSERARRKCLEIMLPLLEHEYMVEQFTIEGRDIAQDKKDIRFIDALRSKHYIDALRIHITRGDSDARLWLPDQMLGAFGDLHSLEMPHTDAIDEYQSFIQQIHVMAVF